MPVEHVGTGELDDVARVVPISEDARHDGHPHLPRAIRRAREIRRPVSDVGAAIGFGQVELGVADVFPVRAAIGGFGDADGCAVHPRDAGEAGSIRAAVGIIHPPAFHERVPDDGGIGRAIVDGVAVKRFGGDAAGGLATGNGASQKDEQ
jgi:hypothetical protein